MRCWLPRRAENAMNTAARWAGKCVWVTRPARQAGALCDAIRARGGDALAVPLLEILPPDAAEAAAVRECARSARAGDVFFFVSPNAVHHGWPLLREAGLPEGVRFAAVGQGSQRALQDAGCAQVIAPTAGFDSEAVLALGAFGRDAIAGRTVFIVRGDAGRPLLGEVLRERGAQVRYVPCYHRQLARAQEVAPVVARARAGTLNAAILTSSEAARALTQVFSPPEQAAICALPFFCTHRRVMESARQAGVKTLHLAEAGDEGLILALESQL